MGKRTIDYREKYLGQARSLRYRQQEIEKWRDAHRDLEAKYTVALDKLKDLSCGLHPSNMPDSWSYPTKLQVSAARTLEQLSKMLQREKP